MFMYLSFNHPLIPINDLKLEHDHIIHILSSIQYNHEDALSQNFQLLPPPLPLLLLSLFGT